MSLSTEVTADQVVRPPVYRGSVYSGVKMIDIKFRAPYVL